MSRDQPRSLPEEALERVIQWLDGPVNARVERLMKRRLVLAPAGLLVTLTARGFIAWRDLDPRALLGEANRARLDAVLGRKEARR